MPMTRPTPADPDLLRELIATVDRRLRAEGCPDSLAGTLAAADELGIPWPPLETWLFRHGGSCDCEVVSNVAPQLTIIGG